MCLSACLSVCYETSTCDQDSPTLGPTARPSYSYATPTAYSYNQTGVLGVSVFEFIHVWLVTRHACDLTLVHPPIPPGPLADNVTCYTLNMYDSFGDGWNGNTWHWVGASGGDTTGTLSSGSSGTAQLCVYNSSCYTFYVDASGNSTEEVSWTVTSGNYTIASGNADSNQTSTCDQDSSTQGAVPL